MLNPTPVEGGRFIPVKGRAWEAWELLAMGEPWSDFAGQQGRADHRTTCLNWPRRQAPRRRPTAQGHLACQVCGEINHRVRRYPHGDRCQLHVGTQLGPATAAGHTSDGAAS
jgi:hypothetical protein